MAKRITISPEQFAEKHARRLKGSLQDIADGIARVTESPTAKAAGAQTKMLQNLTASVTSGKWASRLKAVSLDEWKAKITDKGLGRIAGGIDGAHDKVVAFAGQLLAHEQTLLDSVGKMPDLTLEDSISRMTAWTRGMSKFTRK